jgi:hypothetical protein
MKKIITASLLAATMLLPVTGPVNATSVNQSILRQSGSPMPTGGGGHFTLRQSGSPMPTGGGGHFTLRQSGSPMPTGGGGH